MNLSCHPKIYPISGLEVESLPCLVRMAVPSYNHA